MFLKKLIIVKFSPYKTIGLGAMKESADYFNPRTVHMPNPLNRLSMKNMQDIEPIFLWRDEIHSSVIGSGVQSRPESIPDFYTLNLTCDFCKRNYTKTYSKAYDDRDSHFHYCSYCGFQYILSDFVRFSESAWTEITISIIKQYDINSSDVAFNELGVYIKNNPKKMDLIAPRRFEELVEDIFKNNGFNTILTKSTRDGGIDIKLIEHKTGEIYLVECKKYSEKNHVGVDIVRQLLGVQLIEGVKKAKIVTTSRFSKDAAKVKEKASRLNPSFELELIDAVELLNYLNVYNANIPRNDIVKRIYNNYKA